MIGLDGVSAQALSDAIAADYDCALDPQLRLATRRRIAPPACKRLLHDSTPPIRALVDQVLLRPAPDAGGTARNSGFGAALAWRQPLRL